MAVFLPSPDILLYNTDLVPVGIDQKQHLELARDLGARFNNAYSPTFKIPEPYIPPVGAKVMSLQDPTKKMSKSDDNPNSYILIMDPPEVIRKKISRAVTDSIGVVNYTDEQPGVKNLLDILISIKGYTKDEVVDLYKDKGYADLKKDVDEAPSNVAILGRYIITPQIFEILENTAPGKGNEIQLTDALETLIKNEAMLIWNFERNEESG